MAGRRPPIASWIERPHVLLAILGIGLVSSTSLLASGFSPLALPFALWASLPYGILWMAGRFVQSRWPIFGAAAAALAAELGVRASVMVWPRGSTAALALLFSPAYIAAIVMPAGAALGWISGKLWQWHAAGRVLVVIANPIMLGLLMLGLARPELFPTRVAERRAVLERIGPPRVIAGGDAFEWVPLAGKPAWHVVGELDGQPGEELAIVEHPGADIVDSTSLEVKARVEFAGQPGRLWTSFSTLARLPDGRLVVVDAGGGFSPTRVKDLDGTVLWEYRPGAVTPNALLPADLDGDGTIEFYGAADHVSRLDANGREVWRQPASLAALIALLPQDEETPAWIVGLEYGRRVVVWSADGRELSSRPATAADSPRTAVDFSGRSLIHGGHSVRGFNAAGALAFELPLGDFMLAQVASARIVAANKPHLVVVGATDRETDRWRLLVVDPDRRVVYDEVMDFRPIILSARRADGSDALFVGGEQGLRALRLRRSG